MAIRQGETLTLTPTARLARAGRRHLAAARLAAGDSAWRSEPVLHVGAWLAGLRHQAVVRGVVDAVPISSAQARVLWQEVIDTDVFVGEPRVHQLAERAWRTIHEHRLPHPRDWPGPLLSDDSGRYRDWVARFERMCAERGVIDEWAFASRLPEWIAGDRFELPETIALNGFELPPSPLIKAVFEALSGAGVEIHGAPGSAAPAIPAGLALKTFREPDDELAAAAAWAREWVEADSGQAAAESATGSVAIVVPDLAGRMSRVERIFRHVFDPPGFALHASGSQSSARSQHAQPFHVSLGRPLADWPLAADALLLLTLDPARIAQPDAGRMLASPYLAGRPDEHDRRDGARAALMRFAPYEITGFELVAACRKAGADVLARRLEEWRTGRAERQGKARPSGWVERFQRELKALGFGHGRPLDSVEWQVLARWHELLEEFGALDAVQAGPIGRAEALSLLAERAAAVTFRERDPGCPVEILGVEEALGASFDAVWITTLDADTWPGPAHRDPLIPGPIQAGVPGATHEGRLVRARRELAGLVRTAGEVACSFAAGTEDESLQPTPLLPEPQLVRLEPSPEAGPPEPVALETDGGDTLAPALAGGGVRGGTRGGTGVLTDQSACPFKAFAIRRLGAHETAMPRPGLDPATRGSLAHAALELFWRGLRDQAALLALSPEELERRIDEAADRALGRLTEQHRLLLSTAGRRIERSCLARTLSRWLDRERARGEFRIVALEQKIPISFAGLELTGKIDRIDETAAGTVLIDYKTGASGRSGWKPDPRIRDPQLPAYALACTLAGTPRPAAIAFARLRPDDLRFEGVAESDPGIPGLAPVGRDRGHWKEADDWAGLLAAWQDNLDGLAHAFLDGRAEVDPRDGQTCRTCHLHAFCRIHERESPPSGPKAMTREQALAMRGSDAIGEVPPDQRPRGESQ
ncbi:MAG: PD-(D/E)XK nuclease family protein [Wenzhouxiangellaceae bacterium]|nr:PD-(D/E)XK nuclease family protein [Wenzhouxiangellaceae bacterium]